VRVEPATGGPRDIAQGPPSSYDDTVMRARHRLRQCIVLLLVACGARTPITSSAGGFATSCPEGRSLCAGYCVDEQTDPDNCGVCAGSCAPGVCQNGRCVCPSSATDCPGTYSDGRCLVTLAPNSAPNGFPDGPNGAIAVNSATVYWVIAEEVGALNSVPLCGGLVTTLGYGTTGATAEYAPLSEPIGIALDATSVYWTNELSSHGLYKMPLTGGPPVSLAAGGSGQLAISPTDAYWFDVYGSLLTAPLQGGATVTLAPAESGVTSVAIDATSVYWTTFLSNGGTLQRLPLHGGGSPEALFRGEVGAAGVAVDNTNVYWVEFETDRHTGFIMSLPVAGGVATTLTHPQRPILGSLFCSIVTDNENLYWFAEGNLLKLPIGGGTTTTLVSHQKGLSCLALDRSSVYWTVGNCSFGCAGDVMKLTPK
jgi:hypothetical protein